MLVAVIAVTATILVGLANVVPFFANRAHENDLRNPDSQTPETDSGGIEVGKGSRTKDNTDCVNPPNGPMIC